MLSKIDEDLMRHEADRIYKAVFNVGAPQEVKDRFREPSTALNDKAAADEVVRYYKLIKETNDLEAVELASRWLERIPLLTKKVLLVVHLAETLPENNRFFVNEKDGLLRGLFVIAAGAIRSALKFARGWLYLRKLGNE